MLGLCGKGRGLLCLGQCGGMYILYIVCEDLDYFWDSARTVLHGKMFTVHKFFYFLFSCVSSCLLFILGFAVLYTETCRPPHVARVVHMLKVLF